MYGSSLVGVAFFNNNIRSLLSWKNTEVAINFYFFTAFFLVFFLTFAVFYKGGEPQQFNQKLIFLISLIYI